MFCVSLISSSYGEEWSKSLAEYLLDSRQTFSESALEEAKQYFQTELSASAFTTEDEKERSYLYQAMDAVAAVSVRDLDRAIYTASNDSSVNLFYSLPITHEEERIIHRIITTMADKNILLLALDRKKLERKGKEIEHVHPMRFLGVIFASSHLRHSMHAIRKSGFKWDGFMGGLARRMKEESLRHNLTPYIPGFSEHVRADPEKVASYIHRRDWEGLVRYLL
jgi:hypothetical protein